MTDLLHFAMKVPSVPAERRLSLGAVVAARAQCAARPPWTAIFAKAYAMVAQEWVLARLEEILNGPIVQELTS